MPHAELKYSDDLILDAGAILAEIEATILRHDAGSGACKGRAYPASVYHHSHVLVSVAMLTKEHRNEAFTAALLEDLERVIKARIKQHCHFSLGISYSTSAYVTNLHQPGP
jgi:hypothetical protein